MAIRPLKCKIDDTLIIIRIGLWFYSYIVKHCSKKNNKKKCPWYSGKFKIHNYLKEEINYLILEVLKFMIL